MKTIILLLFLAMLNSCDMNKLPPKEYNYDHSREYKKSINEIWNQLTSWLVKRNVDIKVNNKEEGLIHFEIKIPDSLVYKYTDYSKKGYYNEFFNVVGSVYILSKQIGEFTKVDVMVTYTGTLEYKVIEFKGQYTEKEQVKQNTTGMLEKEILDYISNN